MIYQNSDYSGQILTTEQNSDNSGQICTIEQIRTTLDQFGQLEIS